MTTYKSSKELKGKTLKPNDIVIITIKKEEFIGEVRDSFINFDAVSNSIIFERLKIDKELFCEIFYGTEINRGGDWPECQYGDMTALTRVVLALYHIIEKKKTGILVNKVLVYPYKIKASAILYSSNPILLNSSYTAVLTHRNIKVGCQRIEYSALKELYDEAVERGFIVTTIKKKPVNKNKK